MQPAGGAAAGYGVVPDIVSKLVFSRDGSLPVARPTSRGPVCTGSYDPPNEQPLRVSFGRSLPFRYISQ